MIEIPRVYRHSFTFAPSASSVTQTSASSSESPSVASAERRKKQDRRKRKKCQVVIERRLAPDRRGPIFEAEV